MDWIQDNFQIVIIVVLALGSWLKARMEAKTAAQEEDVEDRDSGSEYEAQEGEWQPPAAVPPPLERHTIPPALPAAVQEAAREAAAILKHQQELAARLRQIREAKVVTSGGADATRLRLAGKGAATDPMTPAPLSLSDRLGNRRELRRALVMREILNRPRGLG